MIPFSVKVFLYKQFQYGFKIGARFVKFRRPFLFNGPSSSFDLCEHIADQGLSTLLVVTDETLLSIGLVQPLVDDLKARGMDVAVYSGVTPDPTVDQIESGLAALRDNRCTGILAVGGGSAIDAAKIIAARARNPYRVAKMAGLFRIIRRPLPLYAIPTTAGTGSEVTIAAVVSDPVRSRKFAIMDPKLVPRAAALDARLMTGLPARITIDTGMDVLTHAVEAYLSRNASLRTDADALYATRIVMEHLPAVVNDGDNLSGRHEMANASFRAGIAFTTAGVGWVHAISHQLGALYHLPHGYLNAVLLPAVLDLYRLSCQSRLAELARVSGLATAELTESELADAFIAHIRDLNSQFGLPSRIAQIRDVDVPSIARGALDETKWTYAVPVYMDTSRIESLIRSLAD